MHLTSSALRAALDAVPPRPDPEDNDPKWAWVENVRLEGRVSDTRRNEFEGMYARDLLDPPEPSEEFWDHHGKYLQSHVFFGRGRGRPAVTFSAENSLAIGEIHGKHTKLVRVEELTTPMQMMGLVPDKPGAGDLRSGFTQLRDTFQAFRGASGSGLSPLDAQLRLNDWLDTWNRQRDTRPVFAAPLSSAETRKAFDRPSGEEKAAALRDLLGLGHLLPRYRKTPVFVAIMKYEVVDVLDHMNSMPHGPNGPMPPVSRDHAFAAPTVLDGPLYPFFFPSPPDSRTPGACFGRTVHLDVSHAGALAAELLHPPFPYLPSHVHDIVELTSAPEPAWSGLHPVRMAHVTKVRGQITNSATFGAPCY